MALAFGLVIMAMVHATGHLSGAHINPAVTAWVHLVGPIVGAALGALSYQVVRGKPAGVSS